MTQFSHLARREDLLQWKRCRYLRNSTDVDHNKRTTDSGCRSRGEFNGEPAMLGTGGPGIHQTIWPYQGQVVWFEWQFPQARATSKSAAVALRPVARAFFSKCVHTRLRALALTCL